MGLFLNLVDAEAHGLKLIVEYGALLAGFALDRACLRGDLLRIVETVLVIHAVMAEGDGLSRTRPLQSLQVERDGLRLLGSVYHLDDNLACCLVEYAAGEKTILSVLSCNGLLVHGQGKDIGTLVYGEELLHIVTDRLEAAEIVEPDGIGAPLPALYVGEERGIGCHVDDIGITLDAGHVGCFIQGGLVVVPLLAVAMTGIFACEYLRTLAVVAVIAQAMGEEPLLVAVVVLVVEIHLQLLHARLQQVEVPSL